MRFISEKIRLRVSSQYSCSRMHVDASALKMRRRNTFRDQFRAKNVHKSPFILFEYNVVNKTRAEAQSKHIQILPIYQEQPPQTSTQLTTWHITNK